MEVLHVEGCRSLRRPERVVRRLVPVRLMSCSRVPEQILPVAGR
jgi:hypothetical protein